MSGYPFDVYAKDFVAVYDDLSLWSALAGEVLLENIPMRPAHAEAWTSVLDVGCGTGFPLIELSARFVPSCKLTGMDMWEEALFRVRDKVQQWRIKNVEISIGNAAAMDFADDSFDLVVSNLGINNFEDPLKVLMQCRRVMKPQGTLAFTTNLTGHMQAFYNAFATVLDELDAGDARHTLDQHIAHRGTMESVGALLTDAEFRIDRTETITKVLRYSNWDAFWTHPFIALAFKPAWEEIAKTTNAPDIFDQVAALLEPQIKREGELRLNVPFAYVEARM